MWNRWILCWLHWYILVVYTVQVVILQSLWCVTDNSGVYRGVGFCLRVGEIVWWSRKNGTFVAEGFILEACEWCAMDGWPRGSVGILLGARDNCCVVL